MIVIDWKFGNNCYLNGKQTYETWRADLAGDPVITQGEIDASYITPPGRVLGVGSTLSPKTVKARFCVSGDNVDQAECNAGALVSAASARAVTVSLGRAIEYHGVLTGVEYGDQITDREGGCYEDVTLTFAAVARGRLQSIPLLGANNTPIQTLHVLGNRPAPARIVLEPMGAGVAPDGTACTYKVDSRIYLQPGIGRYYFVVNCLQRPSVFVGTGSVVDVSVAGHTGNDWTFVLAALGKYEGQETRLFINGATAAVVELREPTGPYACNTAGTVPLAPGGSYTATIRYPNTIPVNAGTGGVVDLSVAGRNGNNWQVRITAKGAAGKGTSIYIDGRPSFSVAIAERVPLDVLDRVSVMGYTVSNLSYGDSFQIDGIDGNVTDITRTDVIDLPTVQPGDMPVGLSPAVPGRIEYYPIY